MMMMMMMYLNIIDQTKGDAYRGCHLMGCSFPASKEWTFAGSRRNTKAVGRLIEGMSWSGARMPWPALIMVCILSSWSEGHTLGDERKNANGKLSYLLLQRQN